MNIQHSSYITRKRNSTTKLLQALDELRSLEVERVSGDMDNALDNGTRSDADPDPIRYGDFLGANTAITKAEMASATTSANALEAFLRDNFHFGNFYNIRG